MNRLDIAIAGAGTGGLAAALALHQLGHRVVIHERFDQPRPVGSGLMLQPTGLGVLDQLGLGDNIRALGAPIERLIGRTSSTGRTVLDVRYGALGPQRGLAVHRAALFNVLFNAVKSAGIDVISNTGITGCEDGCLITAKGTRSAQFDLVIDALGTHSPITRQLPKAPRITPLSYGAIWTSLPWPASGFDASALEQRYDRARVMIGVLPIGRTTPEGPQQAAFFWSLKSAAYAEWKSASLAAWKEDVLRHWPQTAPLLDQITHTDQMTLARYQHHTLRKPFANRLIVIGDAAHSTSPQLGQGANNALLDAQALAQALAQTSDIYGAAKAYHDMRRTHVRAYQALSYVFTPFYQSDGWLLPMLRDQLVAPLSKLPPVRRLLAHMVAGTVVAPLRS